MPIKPRKPKFPHISQNMADAAANGQWYQEYLFTREQAEKATEDYNRMVRHVNIAAFTLQQCQQELQRILASAPEGFVPEQFNPVQVAPSEPEPTPEPEPKKQEPEKKQQKPRQQRALRQEQVKETIDNGLHICMDKAVLKSNNTDGSKRYVKITETMIQDQLADDIGDIHMEIVEYGKNKSGNNELAGWIRVLFDTNEDAQSAKQIIENLMSEDHQSVYESVRTLTRMVPKK